jgi:6-phosphogluconate dehydrogenase
MNKCDFGLIGLAVMGENLVLNIESRGYSVAVFNRTVEKVDRFINGRAQGKNIVGCRSIEELIQNLERPRKAMLLVEEKGLLYIGTGVSGGEEGALRGPSIMPGGSPAAWEHVKPIFQAVSAKAPDGSPCCDWVGSDGAGHFVKMVHNGIEYGDMQMICEAYSLMKNMLGMTNKEMETAFHDWNKGELDSYLIEITSQIMGYSDEETGNPMVEMILDTAGQKGTGRWTSEQALALGIPAMTIAEAVLARTMSAIKEERVAASKILKGPKIDFSGSKKEFAEMIRKALYASKICSYAQGYQLLKAAAEEYHWDLKFDSIALLWRAGCIIRAQFRHFLQHWHTTMVIVAIVYRPICYRPNVIILEHIHTNVSINRAVNSSIPTGPVAAAIRLLRHTMLRSFCLMGK